MKRIAGKRMPRPLVTVMLVLCCLLPLVGADRSDRSRSIRDRYEQVLARNPFQDTAFSRVYDGYVAQDGLDAWIAKLKQADTRESRVLLTRVYERQLDHANAVKLLASLKDYEHPQMAGLAGRIYYRTGDDAKAAQYLTRAVDQLRDLDERAKVCRILGHIHLRQGNRAAAIAVWKRIVGGDNSDLFALGELASIYEDNRMWDEAIGVYQRIIEGAPGDPYRRCQALRQIGIAHLQSERHAQAIAAFEKAFDLVAPGNWMFEDLKQRLVSVYEDQGDLKGLLSYLDSRIESQPGDLDFRLLRAETYRRLELPDEAEKELRYILERRPRDPAGYEELLAFYEEQDRPDEVVATYEKLIELFPDSYDYLRRLGEHQLRQGDRDDARQTWLRALKVSSGAETWVMLAGWYAENELTEDAIDAYESALKLDSQREWMLQLADLKFADGDREGALDLWRSSLGGEPGVAELAEVAMILGRHRLDEEAEEIFRRVLQLNPDDLETRARLARSLMRRDQYPSALEQFDRLAAQTENEYLRRQGQRGQLEVYRRQGTLAQKQKEWETRLAADTNSVELISRLISVHERNGRAREALELHRRLVQIQPDDHDHQRRLALALSRDGQFDEAIKAFEQLAATDRTRARVHLQELLYLHNRTFGQKEAIATAERIVSLAPTDPEVHLQLAQTLVRYRQNTEALAEFRRAANLNPGEPKYWQHYGEVLLQEKKWPEAKLVFERMLDVSVTADARVSALGGLTTVARETGRLDEFISRLKSRARKTPKRIESYEDLAVVYRAADRIDDAITAIEDGLARVDDRAPMLRSLIRYSWEAKDFQRVRKYYRQLVYQRGQPGPFEYERLGRIHARLGEREKALATWQKIIDEFPDNLRALNRLVRVYESEKFYPEALQLREDLLERDPEDHKGRYQYARLLVTAKKPDEAFEQMFRLLEATAVATTNLNVTPSFAATSYPRIRFANRFTLSATYFGRDLRSYFRITSPSSRSRSGSPIQWTGSPSSLPNLVQDLSRMAIHFKQKAEVLARWKKWMESDPDNLRIRQGLVELHEGLQDLDGVVKSAKEYARRIPEDDEMQLKAALYLTHGREYDDAIKLLENVIARTNRFSSLAGQCKIATLLASQRADEAIRFARDFLKGEQTKINSRSAIAGLMKSKAQYAYARELYEEMRQDSRNLADMVDYNLAEISQSEGKRDEAIERFSKLLFAEGHASAHTQTITTLYVPLNRTYVNSITSSSLGIPGHVCRISRYYQARAVSRLVTLVSNFDESDIMKELRKRVESPTRDQRGQPDLLWDWTKMLVAMLLKDQKFDEILKLLERQSEDTRRRVEWHNLKIFTHHMTLDFDDMEKAYSDYEKMFPGSAAAVSRARAELVKARGTRRKPMTYRSGGRVITSSALGGISVPTSIARRPAVTVRAPTSDVRLQAIKSLFKSRKDLGIRVLKSEIDRNGRTPELLSQLAEFYLADGQTNAAVTTVTDAWKSRPDDGNRPTVNKSFFLKTGDTQRVTIKIDPVLLTMHEIYRAAGKEMDLKAHLARRQFQNTKSALTEFAHIHLLNKELETALQLYEFAVKQHQNMPEILQLIPRIKKALVP